MCGWCCERCTMVYGNNDFEKDRFARLDSWHTSRKTLQDAGFGGGRRPLSGRMGKVGKQETSCSKEYSQEQEKEVNLLEGYDVGLMI